VESSDAERKWTIHIDLGGNGRNEVERSSRGTTPVEQEQESAASATYVGRARSYGDAASYVHCRDSDGFVRTVTSGITREAMMRQDRRCVGAKPIYK